MEEAVTDPHPPRCRPPPGRRSGRPPRHPAPVATLFVIALAGCSTLTVEPFPEPLRAPAPETEAESVDLAETTGAPSGVRLTRAPGVPSGPAMVEGTVDDLGEDLTGDPIAVSFRDVAIPLFIDALFNERLGLSYHISPALSEKQDLVTLRILEPIPPSQLFATVRRILEEDYGVRVRQAEDGLLTFEPSEEITTRGIPLLVSGRTLPEVPATHRTVFQVVTMEVMAPIEMERLLKSLLGGLDLEVTAEPLLNAVVLRGKLTTVDRAVAMIDVLDQPLLTGRQGLVIEPVFLDVETMASDLLGILAAQGYVASLGRDNALGATVILLPLTGPNKLVVFAADGEILDRVGEWAEVMDTRQEAAVEEGWFHYQFRNTQAEELIDTLNEILGVATSAPPPGGDGGRPDGDTRSPTAGRPADGLVFIKSTNTVLYRGNGKEWSRIRTFIDQLDRPVPQVLIEVLLAEVTLTGREESGLEYLFNFVAEGRGVDVQLTPTGVALTLDGAGETRALLSMAFEDSRVTIRSRPRLVVKSGESATIFGGARVPIISQRTEGPEVEGTTSIVQNIQYRDTGVTLRVTPIVQANGLVDLEIDQSLSETRAAAAASLTPTILTREINTSLTLRDGQSLLMGGLISEGQSQGRSGVPGLGQLPVLGRLFRSDSYQKDRTELVVMVIPYVIADHRQGRELTEQIKSQLELHRRFL